MLKLNRDYSDYTDETDVNYPEGKAVNASTSESYDGTPLLAEFMNDVNAAHIAMYEKAHGSRDGINGQADTQKASQFADSVAKYTDDKVKAHADKRGLADGVHGATSEATPGQIISRDEYGCAKVSAPIENDDIANKKWVLEAIYPVGSLYWSSKSTNPGELFGGTWKQIKDCFVWAKGDSDTINSTGGSKTVTLGEANMPSHSHSFTPTGSISGGEYSIAGDSVTTDYAGGHSHSTDSQSTKKTGIESANESFYASWHNGVSYARPNAIGISNVSISNSSGSFNGRYSTQDNTYSGNSTLYTISGTCSGDHTHDFSHTHSTDYAGRHYHTFTLSGAMSVEKNPTFSGSSGTTENAGSSAAFNVMNPYVVKYCWERTS